MLTGNRPAALVASNPLDVGVRDREMLCKDVRFIQAVAEDVDAWTMGHKITHDKYVNVSGQRRACKWFLHPMERCENLFLEAADSVLINLMLRERLQAATRELIRSPQGLLASTATEIFGIETSLCLCSPPGLVQSTKQ